MGKNKVKKLLLISLIFIFFPFLTLNAQENCTWAKIDFITHPEDGSIISQSGGCMAGQTQIKYSEAEKKCGTKPTMKASIAGSDTHVCCCGITETEKAENAEKSSAALFKAPDIKIKIPGMDSFSDVKCDTDGNCEVPWLGQYIRGIYNYAIAIAGILAAVVMMGGGLLWLISRGEASKITKAKELIFGSITGMIILLSSYLILTLINPNLVTLENIKIASIKRVDLVPAGSDSQDNLTTSNCKNIDDDLVSIKNIKGISTTASNPYLVNDAFRGLEKAVEIAKRENVSLQINSALRSYETQKALWDDAVKKYGSKEAGIYVANPRYCKDSCYGHCSGRAIDVCIKGTPSCNRIGGKSNANYSDDDVKKLQMIMKEAGWIRYCAEWWHFQYNLNPGRACSP